MNRRCRLSRCKTYLPPHDEAGPYERLGFCCQDHAREHGKDKADQWKKNANARQRKKGPGRRKKQPGWRSKQHLEWIRSLPCASCGNPNSEAHHLIGMGVDVSGMGMTAPDSWAMPLCRICHLRVHHDMNWRPWQWEYLARTLVKYVEQWGQ